MSAPTFAFVNVHVLPMDSSRVLRNRTVLVEGDRIVGVGLVDELPVPDGVPIVDGEGQRYLLPGLTDAHVHLGFDPERWIPIFLTQGVTTVINMRGDPGTLELRRRVADGEVRAPTILTTGPFTNEPGIRTVEDAVRAVTAQRAAGYDFVKIHGNLTAETHRALVAAGREQGIPVIGHAPRNLPFQAVLDSGQPMIVHLEEVMYTGAPRRSIERIPALARSSADAGLWVIHNMGLFHKITDQWGTPEVAEEALAQPEARYLPADMRRYWSEGNPYTGRPSPRAGIERAYAFLMEMLAAFHEEGVRLVVGTDTPVPTAAPGFSMHDELREMEVAGIPPFDILAAATRNPGQFVQEVLDPERRFGQIREGYEASVVLLDGDPLADLAWLRRPTGVMVRGEWLPEGALAEILEDVAAVAR